MRKFVCILTIVCLLFGVLSVPAGASNGFVLTEYISPRPSEPYSLADLALARLSVYGIVDTRYAAPQKDAEEPLSRLDAAVLLYAAYGPAEQPVAALPFLDVPDEYLSAVSWAYTERISYGVSETAFGTADITEAEFLVMLLRMLGYADAGLRDAEADAAQIGLAPVGLSGGFTLGDAALYVQCSERVTTAAGGACVLNRCDAAEQLAFPRSIELRVASAEDAEAQLREAISYLPNTVTLYREETFPEEDFRSYYLAYRESDLELLYGTFRIEPWYLSIVPHGKGLGAEYVVSKSGCGQDALDAYAQYCDCLRGQYNNGDITHAEYRLLVSDKETEIFGTGVQMQFSPTYVNAWKLICDLDDAFTLFADDAVSRWADAFYSDTMQITEGMGDKQIVLMAESAINRAASYDYAEERQSGTRPQAHSIEGLYENSSIVCDGYADCFQYFMLRAGIPCVEVYGSTVSQELAADGMANHAWSKVKIDGAWYNIDLCWADCGCGSQYDLRSDSYYAAHSHWSCWYASGLLAAG